MSSDCNSLSGDRHWHPTGRHSSPHDTDRLILCLSTNCHSDRDIYRSNRHVVFNSRGKYINARCMHLSAYLNLTPPSLLDDFRSASSVTREPQVRGQCSAVNMQEIHSKPPAGASCFVPQATVGCGKTIKRNLILIRQAETPLLPVFLTAPPNTSPYWATSSLWQPDSQMKRQYVFLRLYFTQRVTLLSFLTFDIKQLCVVGQ